MKPPFLQVEPHPIKRVLLVASVVLFVFGAVIGNLSFFWFIDLAWLKAGVRHELCVANCRFVWIRMDQCKLPEDRKIYYEVQRLNPFGQWVSRSAKKFDPWAGEEIGFEVALKRRFLGFEYTTGTFWPPVLWRHSRLPFRRIEVPIWSLSMIGGIYPCLWFFERRLRSKKQKYLVDPSHDSQPQPSESSSI